ncbi:transcriptional regulator [Sphingorhabdus sp.]|uniref:helix-turn-helix transcriptional regulator n=1 Tax=Sphingorhabdus sp. TaxID=1902408 RepID=UPI0039833F84
MCYLDFNHGLSPKKERKLLTSTGLRQDDLHTSDEAPPIPALVVRRVVLDRCKISQAALARIMGISRPWLNQMLTGRNSMSPEFVLRGGKLTATNPLYWTTLQSRFNLH